MPLRPCIVRLPSGAGCPKYAVTGRSYCAEHDPGVGTTPQWRRARKAALDRDGHRCQDCGRTAEQARADGTWLEVHHQDDRAGGVRAKTHDPATLVVLCRTPCHSRTFNA